MRVILHIAADIVFSDDTPDPAPGDPLEDRMREAVREAVNNAIRTAEDNGFSHDMETITSINVHTMELAEEELPE